MTVPEATVNKDDLFPGRKDKVGSAGQLPDVKAVSVARPCTRRLTVISAFDPVDRTRDMRSERSLGERVSKCPSLHVEWASRIASR